MHHAKGIIDRKTIGTKSKIRISTALAKHFEKNPDMQVTSTVRGTHRTEMVFLPHDQIWWNTAVSSQLVIENNPADREFPG